MSYVRTVWKNREVEYPRRYIITDNDDGTVTIEPSPGNIIEEGTPIIAANMNNIEQGIEDAHSAIDEHKADNFHHIPYAIATGTNSYAVNIQGITALTEGMSIKVRFQNANTDVCTLNINGLGAKEIRKSNGNSLSAGNIKAGQILHLVYTGSVFQLLGEGGEYGNVTPGDVIKGVTFGTEEGLKTGTLELTGNAAAADVLSGKTFYSTNPKSKLTGTMPNRGAVTSTITTQGGSYTIPAGYHNGSGKITANFANLVAENIKKGVNIGGVVGTLTEGSFGSRSVTLTRKLYNPSQPSWGYVYYLGGFTVTLGYRPSAVAIWCTVSNSTMDFYTVDVSIYGNREAGFSSVIAGSLDGGSLGYSMVTYTSTGFALPADKFSYDDESGYPSTVTVYYLAAR